MATLFRLIRLFVYAVFACMLTTSASAAEERKFALVIGNNAYPGAALKNAVSDARAMSARFTDLGFEVVLRTDTSRADLVAAVQLFGQKLKGGAVGLFYFAGHGVQVRGKNFLLPIDAAPDNEASIPATALDIDQLLAQIQPARLNVVILDACRSSAVDRQRRNAGQNCLAPISVPTGSLLAYATTPGKIADDGRGSNGLYAQELLNALDVPGLKVEEVFKRARIDVLNTSGNQQIPWESSSLTDEFVFRPADGTRPVPVASLQFDRDRAQLARELEEERRKRDLDKELILATIEKLRAELLGVKTESAIPKNSVTTAPAPVSAPPQKPTPETNSSPAADAPAPIASPLLSAEAAQQWARQIGLLEKLGDDLRYANAFALLLDISAQADLEQLVDFERRLHQAGWSNAYAIGVNSKGEPVWSFGERFSDLSWARDGVISVCETLAKGPCGIIVENRDFRQKAFLELADRLKTRELSVVREAFLQCLRSTPVVTEVFRGSAGNGRYDARYAPVESCAQ